MNMEFIISEKKKVTKKIKFWDKKRRQDQTFPVNVIVLGIDAVSRSHFYRSLPNTATLMKKLGFIDFKGYHSLAPSTLTNFMGFLMGLTRPEVRQTCAKDLTSSFDKCPLIWKRFNQERYITSFIEDGAQSFNWGSQGGFKNIPTDYYFHQYFLAFSIQRLLQIPVRSEKIFFN